MNARFAAAFCLMLIMNYTVWGQTATPTPEPVVTQYRPDYLSDLAYGDLLQVRTSEGDTLRLRASPSANADQLVNLSNGVIVTYLDAFDIQILYNDEGEVSGVEYWYQLSLGRVDDPDFSDATVGWALGARNSVRFLVPAPRFADPNYTPPPPCTDAPDQRLIVGEMGRVLPDAIAALYESPNNPSLVVELAGLDTFTVLSEPVCGFADNYAWQVEYEDITGWVLETDSDGDYRYLVEPIVPVEEHDTSSEPTEVLACTDTTPSNLAVGMMAKADPNLDNPLNVRTRPTITGINIFLLFPDEIVTLTSGPLCYNGTWWFVENERGVKGWVAETRGEEYLLYPFDLSMITPTPTIDAACIVTTLNGVNLREGAGSTFEIVGSAASGASFGADAQAIAEDGVVWWRLFSGEWVASNLTSETEGCANLPSADAPNETAATPSSPTRQVATGTPILTPTPTPTSDCTLTTLQGVNLRSAPNPQAEAIGSAATGATLFADGQSTDGSGFRWWRLAQNQPDSGAWVREDLVGETGTCTALPVIAVP